MAHINIQPLLDLLASGESYFVTQLLTNTLPERDKQTSASRYLSQSDQTKFLPGRTPMMRSKNK